jgi:hypothetical protein
MGISPTEVGILTKKQRDIDLQSEFDHQRWNWTIHFQQIVGISPTDD